MSFISVILEHVQKQVTKLLRRTEAASQEEIENIFTDSSVVRPFEELETEYRQTKYFQRNFGLVVSIHAYIVGPDLSEHLNYPTVPHRAELHISIELCIMNPHLSNT